MILGKMWKVSGEQDMEKESRKPDKKKADVPTHHGRFPFEPDKKRPAVLKEEMRIPRLYGKDGNFIGTYTCASTDKIHVSTFSVLPGRYFDPPDIHPGDEVYYILKGEAKLFNPDTGKVLSAEKGDFVYIPAGTWHQVWNFGNQEMTLINWIAPQLWSNDAKGTSISYDKKPVYYKTGLEE